MFNRIEPKSKPDTQQEQIDQNTADIANKADDVDVVHKTGNETITGSKTFSGIIGANNPADRQALFYGVGKNQISIEHDGNRFYFYNVTTGKVLFSMLNDGKIGVGTANPTKAFEIAGVNSILKTDIGHFGGNADGSVWKLGVTGDSIFRGDSRHMQNEVYDVKQFGFSSATGDAGFGFRRNNDKVQFKPTPSGAWEDLEPSNQDSFTDNMNSLISLPNMVANGFFTNNDNRQFNFESSSWLPVQTDDGLGTPGYVRARIDTSATKFIDKKFPVNPELTYKISSSIKLADSNHIDDRIMVYMMMGFFDMDGLLIGAPYHMYMAGTKTTLSADLNNGDTVVHLTDVSNWADYATNNTYRRRISFYDYHYAGGSWAGEYYTRHLSAYPLWDVGTGAIDAGANTITLKSAWTGGTIPAGTIIRQSNSGGSYKYSGFAGTTMNRGDGWVSRSGLFSGVDYSGTNKTGMFTPGASFANAGWLLPYRKQREGTGAWTAPAQDGSDNDLDVRLTKVYVYAQPHLQRINGDVTMKFEEPLPTSSAGLPANTIWNDSGTLKIT